MMEKKEGGVELVGEAMPVGSIQYLEGVDSCVVALVKG